MVVIFGELGDYYSQKKMGFFGIWYNSEWDYQKKINPTHYDISNFFSSLSLGKNGGKTLGIGGPQKISNPMNTPYIGIVFIEYILLPQKKIHGKTTIVN